MKHTHHHIDRNSLKALKEEKAIFSRRENEILGVLHRALGPMTDREIMLALGYSDMNSVRPRITELMERFWIKKVTDTFDPTTKKEVRCVVALTTEERMHVLASMETPNPDQLDLFPKAA